MKGMLLVNATAKSEVKTVLAVQLKAMPWMTLKEVIGSRATTSLGLIKSIYRNPMRINLIIVLKIIALNFITSLQKVVQSLFISISNENAKEAI